MKHKRQLVLAAALAASAAFCSAATTSMRPGLWEMNSKVKSGDSQATAAMAEAQKQLANLPPEQRKMIEDMMAKQGVGMTMGSDGGVRITYCMTREMAERKELPTGQGEQCTSTSTPVAGGMNVSFQCAKPPSSGTGQVRLQGETGYTMNMNVTSSARGKPETMAVESTGRWLGADCGGKAPAK
ncbi:DUF3617 domain-containing protein [Pseudoduganella namucuonensis]|uniref:DUF3617 family protein n=1 Tax=Pseudoduganella namucuonensis TaxID=1035707 RepID=A0A1I7J4G9_9BURK|nr:DUF3617 domain-containing protein [Pseudoduganella namucuonensis]SFU80099.1 Protein of unknown function [Pseudoduganella namucuonensis]